MRLLVVAIAAFVTLTEGAVEVSLTPGQVALGEVLEEKSPGISGYDNYERSAPGILGMAGARHEDFRSSVLGDPVGRSLADEQELAAARRRGLFMPLNLGAEKQKPNDPLSTEELQAPGKRGLIEYAGMNSGSNEPLLDILRRRRAAGEEKRKAELLAGPAPIAVPEKPAWMKNLNSKSRRKGKGPTEEPTPKSLRPNNFEYVGVQQHEEPNFILHLERSRTIGKGEFYIGVWKKDLTVLLQWRNTNGKHGEATIVNILSERFQMIGEIIGDVLDVECETENPSCISLPIDYIALLLGGKADRNYIR